MSRPNEYHWTFSTTNHIEFVNGGPPVVRPSVSISSDEGTATLSDPVTGQLLMYTNGETLNDGTHAPVAITGSNLGGDDSSSQSAIVIPRIGTSPNIHVFATKNRSQAGAFLQHSIFSVSGATLTEVSPPTPALGTTVEVTERVAATSASNCGEYWLVTQERATNPANFHLLLINQSGISTSTIQTPVPYPSDGASGSNTSGELGCMKFSPDGTMLAYADFMDGHVVVCDFNRSTGVLTHKFTLTEVPMPYGVEFSPDSNLLYYSSRGEPGAGQVHQSQTNLSGSILHSSANTIYTMPNDPNRPTRVDYVGALQLGPDNKIYCSISGYNYLAVINQPNLLGSLSDFQTRAKMDDGSGNIVDMTLNQRVLIGLPTFTRIADDCVDGDVCLSVANDVNEFLSERAENDVNRMRHCDGRRPRKPQCRDLRIPSIRPHIEINWGDSECDCIESDDTETLSITVCNTYSNITLSHFTIHKLEVVDANGNPVATLPDGTPSVELTPIGPFCFGDIASCSCVSREFVLRNRGAIAGEYHIRATGVCYDVNLHYDDEACFKFDICAD